jgi:hypothetical protein
MPHEDRQEKDKEGCTNDAQPQINPWADNDLFN